MDTSALPAVGSAPVAPAPAPSTHLDLASLSVDQLNQLQAGTFTPPQVTAPPPPATTVIRLTNADPTNPTPLPGTEPAAPAAPVPTTPPVAAPATPPAEPDAPETTGRFRIETTNYRDAEVMRLIAKSQAEARANPELRPLTIPEAYERVYGTGREPTTQTTTPPTATPSEVPADPAVKVKADIEAKTAAAMTAWSRGCGAPGPGRCPGCCGCW